ncbi:hypothetical protein TNCV_711071 [Trichonephila clavipes]|nr:hypothetical protein TNCV_711071 [Trichonephila clavipes]
MLNLSRLKIKGVAYAVSMIRGPGATGSATCVTNRVLVSKKEPRRNFDTRPTQNLLRQCSKSSHWRSVEARSRRAQPGVILVT